MARIPRTTTIGSLKTYRYDLNRSSYTMNKAMEKVNTQRNFNSFAEDPAVASRCFQLRRSYLRTSSQYTINESVRSKYQQAWDALDSISEDIGRIQKSTCFGDILTSLNGADASGRNALGQDMVAKANSIIQTMNGRYGENFIFSGADTLNVPFTWGPTENPAYIDPETADPTNPDHAAAFQYMIDPAKAQNGELYTNTAADALQVPKENSNYDQTYTDLVDARKAAFDANDANDPNFDPDFDETAEMGDSRYGKYLKSDGTGTNDDTDTDVVLVPKKNDDYNPDSAYKYLTYDRKGTNSESAAARTLLYRGVSVDENDNEKMNYFLNSETKYMDLGLGYKEKDGEVVSTSVFDAALQGVFYLGDTGTSIETVESTDEDGNEIMVDVEVPNNIVSIIDRMGQILLRCNADNGNYASKEDEVEALALARQFEDVMSVVSQRYVELDAQTGFLRDNGELLSDQATTLNEQFLALEDIDPAYAISDFMYAKYCYDTALKVGNSILSQSLMDYLNL